MKTFLLGGALIAIALIAVGGYYYPLSDIFGAVGTRMPNGVAIGSSGTNNRNVIDTTCTLIVPYAISHTASTTKPYDCAVSGITSSFNVVIAQIATSTAYANGLVMGFVVVGAKASTTAGYATVDLFNGAGVTTDPSIFGYGSSTAIHAVQTQTQTQ